MKLLFRLIVRVFGFLIIFILAVNIVIYAATKAYVYNNVAEVPKAEVALIPGAAILRDGSLSPVFRDRANTAITLYEANKVSKVLISGNSSTESLDEVNPAHKYLLSKGIPDEDIFLDHKGLDTYSTMYRARNVFGVASVLIATQSFHLPRAVFLARRMGMAAYGVNADAGRILFRNHVREVFAGPKAVLDLIFKREPKYLGEKIPI